MNIRQFGPDGFELIREPEGDPVPIAGFKQVEYHRGEDGRFRYVILTVDIAVATGLEPGTVGRLFARFNSNPNGQGKAIYDLGFWEVEASPLVSGGHREVAAMGIRLVEPGKPKSEKRRGILGFLWR